MRDDYLQEDLKKEIEEFNGRLEQCLSDENFVIEGDGKFDSIYLDDIDDNNAGVEAGHYANPRRIWRYVSKRATRSR